MALTTAFSAARGVPIRKARSACKTVIKTIKPGSGQKSDRCCRQTLKCTPRNCKSLFVSSCLLETQSFPVEPAGLRIRIRSAKNEPDLLQRPIQVVHGSPRSFHQRNCCSCDSLTAKNRFRGLDQSGLTWQTRKAGESGRSTACPTDNSAQRRAIGHHDVEPCFATFPRRWSSFHGTGHLGVLVSAVSGGGGGA